MPGSRARSNVVVLRSGAHLYGLVVDQLHDNEEIVVKPVSVAPGRLRLVRGRDDPRATGAWR